MSSYHGKALPRFFPAIVFGLVLTLALFYVMTVLIRGEDMPEFADPPVITVNFLPVLEDQPVPPRRPVEPPPAPTPPPVIRLRPDVTTQPGSEVGPWIPPVVTPTGPVGGVGVSDGEAVPLVTGTPEYPARAVTNGIQGWVIVEFTIDPQGRVKSPRVVEGQPRGIFDRSALNAIQRYKYKPRVVNGESVSVEGIRQRIVFELTH